jgi:hypothetical protein
MCDIQVTNHGSIFVLTGKTSEGKSWIEDHLIAGNDEIQMWCGGVVVEPRYVEAIIDGACNDGIAIT